MTPLKSKLTAGNRAETVQLMEIQFVKGVAVKICHCSMPILTEIERDLQTDWKRFCLNHIVIGSSWRLACKKLLQRPGFQKQMIIIISWVCFLQIYLETVFQSTGNWPCFHDIDSSRFEQMQTVMSVGTGYGIRGSVHDQMTASNRIFSESTVKICEISARACRLYTDKR